MSALNSQAHGSMAPALPALPERLSFGVFALLPGERVLQREGQPVKLGGRAFDLLLALVARRGRVVGKDELFDVVWPGLVVEENNLQVHVSALRKALGTAAISTVPGRGYQFTLALTDPVSPGPVPASDSAAAGFAAAASPDASPPASPTATSGPAAIAARTLFGRTKDLRAVRDLLRTARVVSVVGAGGIGKTRLARELATHAQADAPGSAWWVDLVAIAQPGLLESAVAGVLGIALAADRSARGAVLAAMAPRRGLLVLDNCEHLLPAVAGFVEALVAAAPEVQVLVTTQEPLKAIDEQVYRLGTLEVPAPDAGEAEHCGAVELFTARAHAVDPRFTLDAHTLPVVIDICQRLDGIALAIELAAARLPLLGLLGLRDRLDERFKLLTGGARAVLRRHQTLRAALDWSHGLLNAGERVVLRRVSVFAGSFSMEAAQAVARDDTHDDWAVLDHLGGLVDKSMVTADDGERPRYRLLETTRAFGLEQLAAAGETEALLLRHAEALLALLEGCASYPRRWRLTSAEQRALGAEIHNLRAALDWCEASARRPLAMALMGASYHVWYGAGSLFIEGLQRCLALRDVAEASPVSSRTAAYWLNTARLGLYLASLESYEASAKAAAEYRALGQASPLYDALSFRALIAVRRGAGDSAGAALREAAAIEDPTWLPRQRASLCFAQLMHAKLAGRPEDALAFAWQQAALYREDGLEEAEQLAIGNAASELARLGRFTEAEHLVRPAIARLDALGSSAQGHNLETLADALVGQRRFDEAIPVAKSAHRLLRSYGDETRLLLLLGVIGAETERFIDAARLAGAYDSETARRGVALRPYQAGRRAKLQAMLTAALDPTDAAALQSEGAAMSLDSAFELGFDIGHAAPAPSGESG